MPKYLISPKNGKIFKKIFFKYLNIITGSIDKQSHFFTNTVLPRAFDKHLLRVLKSESRMVPFKNLKKSCQNEQV